MDAHLAAGKAQHTGWSVSLEGFLLFRLVLSCGSNFVRFILAEAIFQRGPPFHKLCFGDSLNRVRIECRR